MPSDPLLSLRMTRWGGFRGFCHPKTLLFVILNEVKTSCWGLCPKNLKSVSWCKQILRYRSGWHDGEGGWSVGRLVSFYARPYHFTLSWRKVYVFYISDRKEKKYDDRVKIYSKTLVYKKYVLYLCNVIRKTFAPQRAQSPTEDSWTFRPEENKDSVRLLRLSGEVENH